MTPGAKVADAFFLDELGYVLKNGEPIIAKDESLRTSVTDLRIDYIHGDGDDDDDDDDDGDDDGPLLPGRGEIVQATSLLFY